MAFVQRIVVLFLHNIHTIRVIHNLLPEGGKFTVFGLQFTVGHLTRINGLQISVRKTANRNNRKL